MTTDEKGGDAGIATIHPDIIQAHILTRLDGPTLASASCASSNLHALCVHEKLWREICTATWPSAEFPIIRRVISTFPGGHRSFFSSSFPLLHHQYYNPPCPKKCPKNNPSNYNNVNLTLELISAVDMYYKGEPIFSKAQSMETLTGLFLNSSFLVELLDPKEMVPTPIKNIRDTNSLSLLKHLEENVTLSWVMIGIDPNRKRAANLSSRKPVAVERHWLTGDILLRYSIIMSAADRGLSEFVQCAISVNLGAGKEGDEMVVKEVSLRVEDMDGKHMNGRESLRNLQEAMENGERKREKGDAVEVRQRYEEFLERKREKTERVKSIEKAWDMVCISTLIPMLMAFCLFRLFH